MTCFIGNYVELFCGYNCAKTAAAELFFFFGFVDNKKKKK